MTSLKTGDLAQPAIPGIADEQASTQPVSSVRSCRSDEYMARLALIEPWRGSRATSCSRWLTTWGRYRLAILVLG